MTKNALRQEWENRIQSFQASGQSLSAWCTSHNLKIHQARYWLRKLRGEQQPAANTIKWLAVELQGPEAESKGSSVHIKVGSATIEVQPGFNPKLLLEVVRTLSTC